MAKQVVSTDRIAASANNLCLVNNNINREFGALQNKAQQLNSNWKSAAGDAAKTTMYQLFKNNDVRSTVIQNYINILERQVNPGYVSTENVNTKLADSFK